MVLQLANRVELLVLVFAAWHVGAVAVPVVPMYRGHEMAHILRATRPAATTTAATMTTTPPIRTLLLPAGLTAAPPSPCDARASRTSLPSSGTPGVPPAGSDFSDTDSRLAREGREVRARAERTLARMTCFTTLQDYRRAELKPVTTKVR